MVVKSWSPVHQDMLPPLHRCQQRLETTVLLTSIPCHSHKVTHVTAVRPASQPDQPPPGNRHKVSSRHDVRATWTPTPPPPPFHILRPLQPPTLPPVLAPVRPAPLSRPLVVPISDNAFSALLPISGTGEQVLQELGGPATWIRRAVVSVAGAVIFYNVHVFLTVVAAFYWAWSPMISAMRLNTGLRLRYKYAGLWRARIQEVELVQPREGGPQKMRVVVGDDSGARVEMRVAVPISPMVVRRGEPAELLVLSDTSHLSRFRAVREVFLPAQNVWIAERPYLERVIFADMSGELASMLSEGEDDEVDWTAQYNLVASDNEQDLVTYKPYDAPLQRQGSFGSSTPALGNGPHHTWALGDGDSESIFSSADLAPWSVPDNLDVDSLSETMREVK